MSKLIPKDKMGVLDILSVILLLVGGLNWGFAVFGFNPVQMIAGIMLSKIIFFLVGISAVFSIYRFLTITKKMEILDYVAVMLLIAGGLNWGLVAIGFNLVELIVGVMIAKIVYALVFASAIYSIYAFIKLGMKK